ncbi:THAP domain-containing protein 5-like isoform X1 [Poecilia reticulata]|uniref:THAP domain-containing protein 5-like isoform X1 n=1 Tax=Poecilia reticulata TaxID=8081 RepID=UPI0004A2A122|nr:PREDICTED: THAP domain-containing protein 5-like isoform X1 [Poecilia reticulata]
MPKYCSVPNCRSDSANSSERKSFYKFPLQDPTRLQQWVRNMGRENWTPSRHQYICHEHFSSSCFKVRWGIRYLDADAVPTVFPDTEKRKASDDGERKPKRQRAQSSTVSADGPTADQTVRLLELSVAALPHGETGPMESSVGSLQTGVDPADGVASGLNFPLTLYQTADGLMSDAGAAELLMMSDGAAEDGQVELVNGITAAILSQGGVLVLNEAAPDPDLASFAGEDIPQEVVAYFETVPNVLPGGTSTRVTSPPDTVLSPALSSKPISSTLPIVSKHVPTLPPPSLVLTLERLDEAEDGDAMTDTEETERDDQQLEEHCYHKNSLSKEQLEAIVAELQKKVKVLQQRHRRHLEKLLGLENTVSQLRQSNMLNEERLQLLERAYLQTSASVSDAGETVAIIYGDDDAAYFYTPLSDDAGMALNTDEK